MADSAADKSKDKKKKKPAAPGKEKDVRRKSGVDDAATGKEEPKQLQGPPAVSEGAPKPAVNEKAPEATPKPEDPAAVAVEEPKPEAAVKPEEATEGTPTEKPKKKKDSKKQPAKADGGEKTEQTPEEVEAPAEGEDADEQPKPIKVDEDLNITHSYVVPPPPTKKDIDVLMDMDENKLIELREAFALFDLNQDGYIDHNDLKLTYQTLGQPDVADDDIFNMLSEAINPLDFDAFVVLLGYKTIEMDPESVLVEALSQWDYSGLGMISEDRIRHDLMTWGDKFTKEEVDMALEDAPTYITKKGVAMIDYLKFCDTLCGLRKKPKIPSAP